jgi:hypothetical protein
MRLSPNTAQRRWLFLLAAMFLLGVSGREVSSSARARPEAASDTRTVEVPTIFPGIITCSKCDLKRTIKCGTVLLPAGGGGKIAYPFDDLNHKKYHRFICVQSKKGTVTGKLVEKDGQTIIAVEKVAFD